MAYNKVEIEKRLKDMLHEILRDFGQESSSMRLNYNEDDGNCTINIDVHIVEKDDYIGFGVY